MREIAATCLEPGVDGERTSRGRDAYAFTAG